MANNKRIIAVDLDGTLVHYDGWKGIDHIGPVIPEIANAMERAQREGAEVHLFTARVSDPDDAAQAHQIINTWALQNGFHFESITAVKQKFFTEFWDDRAIQVIKNAGMFVLSESTDDIALDDRDDHGYSEKQSEKMGDAQVMEQLVGNGSPLFTPVQQSSMDVQVDGNHYSKLVIQPAEYALLNGLGPIEAMIIKYVTRHQDKAGRIDLEKAKHFIDMLIEHKYEGTFHEALLKRLQVIDLEHSAKD